MKNVLQYMYFDLNKNTKIQTFKITDYSSVCLSKLKTYLSNLDSTYFVYLKAELGSKIEKICYDYYNNEDYYDIILLLNSRDIIFDMSYPNDIILEAIESDIDRYRSKVFKDPYKQLSELSMNDLTNSLQAEYEKNNLKFLYIKAIKNTYMPIILSDIREILESYQENIELVNLEGE